MRISDWSSDVCSSDLRGNPAARTAASPGPALQRETLVDISKIPVGMNPPWDVNAIVEVPLGAHPVKYEMDKDSGAIFVDRFLHTSMQYPLNYGFIPTPLPTTATRWKWLSPTTTR